MKRLFQLLTWLLISFSSSAIVLETNKTAILVKDNVKSSVSLKQAFAQILSINTGESIESIISNPAFKQAKINSGVKRSYFERIPTEFQYGEDPYQFWFHLVMNQEYIDKVIHLADFSLWPHNRDKIMLWSTSQDEDAQTVFNENDATMKYWTQRWAQALGLIIVFPETKDLSATDGENNIISTTESLKPTPNSIKNLTRDAAEFTKQEYDLNHNLLLFIDQQESIKIRSGFFDPNHELIIKHYQEDNNQASLYYMLMSDLAVNYANLYRLKANEIYPHTQQVALVSINSYDEVLEITNYLKNLSVIESYEVIKATSSELVLRMQLKVTNEAFTNLINRGTVLQVTENHYLHQISLTLKQHD